MWGEGLAALPRPLASPAPPGEIPRETPAFGADPWPHRPLLGETEQGSGTGINHIRTTGFRALSSLTPRGQRKQVWRVLWGAPGLLLGHRVLLPWLSLVPVAVQLGPPAWELLSTVGSCPAQAGPTTVWEGGIRPAPCLDWGRL